MKINNFKKKIMKLLMKEQQESQGNVKIYSICEEKYIVPKKNSYIFL